LLLTGLIGGGPTFVGTVIGNSFVNDTVFLLFLALAAGSILYVVVQLLKMAARMGQTEVLMWGLLIGLVLGFGTDYVLVISGG
jgi:ZIP family zinc transporter